MLQICSGIYLIFIVIAFLLFRITLFEAHGYSMKEKQEYDS